MGAVLGALFVVGTRARMQLGMMRWPASLWSSTPVNNIHVSSAVAPVSTAPAGHHLMKHGWLRSVFSAHCVHAVRSCVVVRLLNTRLSFACT